MPDVRALNVFLQAAEAANFSQAARRLGITQPAVSQHIRALEKELGTLLFHRAGRRIRLTEAGEVLVPMARRMVHLSTHIDETMGALDGRLSGHLRIACTTTSGKYILPHLIARFREQHPHAQATIELRSPRTAIRLILDNIVDLGVLSTEPHEEEIEFRSFFMDHIVLIVPHDHPWAERGTIEPHELVKTPFIIREPSSGTRLVMLNGLSNHGIRLDDLNVVMTLGSSEAIEMAVGTGIGVSFVPRLATECYVKAGYVKEVAVAGLELKRPIQMLRKRRRPPTKLPAAFWDFIHQPENETLLQLAS